MHLLLTSVLVLMREIRKKEDGFQMELSFLFLQQETPLQVLPKTLLNL